MRRPKRLWRIVSRPLARVCPARSDGRATIVVDPGDLVGRLLRWFARTTPSLTVVSELGLLARAS
jgi:hypothetical protein